MTTQDKIDILKWAIENLTHLISKYGDPKDEIQLGKSKQWLAELESEKIELEEEYKNEHREIIDPMDMPYCGEY